MSAALRFELDEEAMTARLVQALRHEDRYGYAMGNAQYLPDGHVLVGWGMDPYATEFDGDGEVVFELSDLGLGSYRSYRFPWRGAGDPAGPRGGGRIGVRLLERRHRGGRLAGARGGGAARLRPGGEMPRRGSRRSWRWRPGPAWCGPRRWTPTAAWSGGPGPSGPDSRPGHRAFTRAA